MPPVPPQVTFRNGMLTVQAINSTMSSLLQAIRGKTGIQFEGGENSPDRVAISVGPAPEGEVLSSIFTGSNFDYVVVDRQDSPGIVQRVILTPRARGGAGAVVANGQPSAPQQQGETQAADDQTNADDQANADTDQPQDVPEEPPQVQPTPEPETQQQSNPKTPEQLLQELKELQQQQQQQQQPNETQNPAQVPRKPPQ